MNIPAIPKYTIPEIERRWLAIEEKLPELSSLVKWDICDRYIINSRLRLRKLSQPGDESVTRFKLCKKYGKISGINEPITNVYLTRKEFEILSNLPGNVLHKVKYQFPYNGVNYAICIFEKSGLTTVEAEFKSEEEAMNAQLPNFIGKEVSSNLEYESASIAKL